MLLSLRFVAILVGAGAGSLLNALLALSIGATLAVLGVENGPSYVLLPSLLIGLMFGGYIAARMALHSHVFHGAVTGIVIAIVTFVIARLGGSPATLTEILILALVSTIFGAIGGAMSKQTRRRRR